MCRERRLEFEAVGALRRCGSCPERRRAGLVGCAIGDAWEGPAAEVAWGISGTPSQAWERRA